MAGTLLGIRDDPGERRVDDAPVARRRVAIDRRPEQRVAERDPAVEADLDQAVGLGRGEFRGRDERGRRAVEGRDAEQRGAGCRRQPSDAVAGSLDDRLRHWQRRRGVRRAALDDPSRDLEGVERVAAGDLGDPLDRRPRQLPAEPGEEQVVEAADGQGTEYDPPDPDVRQGLAEAEQDGRAADRRPDGRHEADLSVAKPAGGEHQRVGGRAVQPLGVVDRDHQRPLCGEPAEDRGRPRGDGPRVDYGVVGLGPQEREIEGAALGRRQVGDRVVEVAQEVGETAERQTGLGLRGSGREQTGAAVEGDRDRGVPERGLADPLRPLDDQGRRTAVEMVEHRACRLEFHPAAQHPIGHCADDRHRPARREPTSVAWPYVECRTSPLRGHSARFDERQRRC